MDFAAWQQHLVAALGHEAAVPWHEPCRLDGRRQQALGRFSRRSAVLMEFGAGWYDRLADDADTPAEEAAIRLVARAYTGHAGSLRRLAATVGDQPVDWPLPAMLPLLPVMGRWEQLTVLHGIEVVARVWHQALVDAVAHDPLASSVFAAMLYERAFLLAYARERLAEIGQAGGLRRRHVQIAHAAALPLVLPSAWAMLGADFRILTGWDWATCVRRCHHAYERTYFGDLAFLRRRGVLTGLAWLPF